MTYPLDINVNIIQEDFIEVDMLEHIVESIDEKNQSLKTYIWQTIIFAAIAAILFLSSWASKVSVVFPFFFWLFVSFNFLYKYFYGYKNELNMAVSHLIVNNDKGYKFFTQEIGVVSFYEDKCEYVTNEERRYFEYSYIQHIKTTKRLFIFVITPSKEKSIRGFSYMIIPKRDLNENQEVNLLELTQRIVKKYSLLSWIEDTVFD